MPRKKTGGGNVNSQSHVNSHRIAWGPSTSSIPVSSAPASARASSRARHVRLELLPTPHYVYVPKVYVPKVFEKPEDKERRLRMEQAQAQVAKQVKKEQDKEFERLIHFRDAQLLTQKFNHPLLYPNDLPDVLAARAQYVAQTQASPHNIRLLTQLNAEINAMSGKMPKDDVHFLAYDLDQNQPAAGRANYNAARRKFANILEEIRDLPRQRQEAAQKQADRINYQAVMRNSIAYRSRPSKPPIKFEPW